MASTWLLGCSPVVGLSASLERSVVVCPVELPTAGGAVSTSGRALAALELLHDLELERLSGGSSGDSGVRSPPSSGLGLGSATALTHNVVGQPSR